MTRIFGTFTKREDALKYGGTVGADAWDKRNKSSRVVRGRTYYCKKTFPFSLGLSCCFRQWRATDSHCRFLHGYALEIELMFHAKTLDDRNWVVDFGSMGEVRDYLKSMFDHKLLVAVDDPMHDYLLGLAVRDLAHVLFVPATGCEAFADMIADWVGSWLQKVRPGAELVSVEVREHPGNAAGIIETGASPFKS